MEEIIVVDRSRYELSFECPREFWWTYNYNGLGIVPNGKALYFVTGEAIHVGVQALMLQLPFSTARERIMETFSKNGVDDQEQIDLSLALVRAWERTRQKAFLAEYRPLPLGQGTGVEREIVTPIYERNGRRVLLMSRPDIIVERLSDGAVLDWELKSTGVANEGWHKKWEHAFQLLLQVHATNHLLKEHGDPRSCVGIVVEGLVKGSRKKDSTGLKRFTNPLIYGYVQRGDGFIVKDQWTHKWRKGLTKELVSGSMDLLQWIDSLPEEVVQDHIRIVPPILASPSDIGRVLLQVGSRAVELHERKKLMAQHEPHSGGWEVALDQLWPQNFNNCHAFGDESCAFLDVCFQHTIGSDPLGSGLFKKREPNHPIEVELANSTVGG